MKKIFIIALAATVLAVFTGCHIDVDTDFHHHMYDFTFNNNTDWDIGDWYLKDSYGINHSKKGDKLNKVYAYEKSTMYDLDRDYYTVYFSYERRPNYYDYYTSEHDFLLDTDTEYKLYQDHFYERSAITESNNINNEPNFYLVDSNGKTIKLIKQ